MPQCAAKVGSTDIYHEYQFRLPKYTFLFRGFEGKYCMWWCTILVQQWRRVLFVPTFPMIQVVMVRSLRPTCFFVDAGSLVLSGITTEEPVFLRRRTRVYLYTFSAV